MSALTTTFNNRTRRAYISMAAFNADIYSYTASLDPTTFINTGVLGAVTGATASNCPQGRFLYENGKKLFPGAHPGVSTYMVGVFDPISFLSGFIDPNSEIFTLMNTDKPVDLASSTNTFGTNPTTSLSDLAYPVYTRGDIITTGHIRSEPFTALTAITTNGQNVVLDTTLGENFSVSATSLTTGVNFDISGNINAGDVIRVFITTSAGVTVGIVSGTNTSVSSGLSATAAAMNILTFTSNGSKFYQTSFIAGLTV